MAVIEINGNVNGSLSPGITLTNRAMCSHSVYALPGNRPMNLSLSVVLRRKYLTKNALKKSTAFHSHVGICFKWPLENEVYWQLLWEAIMGKIPVKSEQDSIKGKLTCRFLSL